MNEKELALILQKDAIELENSNCQSCCPVPQFNDIDNCNFKLLQQECNKLNFHICRTNESPFDKRYYRTQYKKGAKYMIYTDNSINHISYN